MAIRRTDCIGRAFVGINLVEFRFFISSFVFAIKTAVHHQFPIRCEETLTEVPFVQYFRPGKRLVFTPYFRFGLLSAPKFVCLRQCCGVQGPSKPWFSMRSRRSFGWIIRWFDFRQVPASHKRTLLPRAVFINPVLKSSE